MNPISLFIRGRGTGETAPPLKARANRTRSSIRTRKHLNAPMPIENCVGVLTGRAISLNASGLADARPK